MTATRRYRRAQQRRRRVAAGLLVFALAAAVFAVTRGSSPLRAPVPRIMSLPAPAEPVTYRPADAGRFVSRATAGEAHALFSESPGGVVATAARVSHLRA